MRKRSLRSILAILLGLLSINPPAFAQGPFADSLKRYQAVDIVSLSGSGERLTVQQVVSAKKTIIFEWASVYCSVACVATLYQNGTAATATALTPNQLNKSPAPGAAAFSASNAGNGSWANPPQYTVPAGSTYVIDLAKVSMDFSSVQNLSLALGSMTGTAQIVIQWVER